jgi:hypothetical protein
MEGHDRRQHTLCAILYRSAIAGPEQDRYLRGGNPRRAAKQVRVRHDAE